ncbi:unknown [Mycoplasma sp. CAG:776]|nr:unknown [Mycoplasma sp. CAG:776]
MIIKKPYAFIIKHFRLIHLLLLIPMFYLVTQTKEIITFFSEYVANDYTLASSTDVLSSLASNYINIFMYIAVIVIMIVLIFLTIVLQRKEKPTKFYNISIVYYLVLFILITVNFAIFKAIENDTLDPVFARLIRDLAMLIHYSQYIFIIYTGIRGIGFNIKKFDFKSDLSELEISTEDNEEIEFLIGIDSDKAKRTMRRFLRETKYYYKENKFIFIMIFIILIGVAGTLLYMNEEVYQRVYKENDNIASGYLNFKIKDSFISNLSKNGKVLNKDKYYVILELEITNRYREDHEFNYVNLELTINNKYVLPDLSIAHYFNDYGTPYSGTYIKGNTSNDYILVYEIDKNLINQDFLITVYSHYDGSVGGIGTVNHRISLDPTLIDENIISNNVSLGTNINLSNTNLGNSEFVILDYEFTRRYEYTYDYCLNSNKCIPSTGIVSIDYTSDGTNKTLLVLDYDLSLDEEIPYMNVKKSFKSVFEDYTEIIYQLNGKTYSYKVTLANPTSYDEKAIIKVPSEIENADRVELVLTIRNISYRIRLI